jgi:hypothetical protein
MIAETTGLRADDTMRSNLTPQCSQYLESPGSGSPQA